MSYYIKQKTEKTYTISQWNNMLYYFKSEGFTELDCDKYKELVLELDHKELLNNVKETRRHEYYDSFPTMENNKHTGLNTQMSQDYYMHQNNLFHKNPADEILHKYEIEAIHDKIKQLKKIYQDVIYSVYYYGLSLTEYARLIGITPQAASQRMMNAKKRLKPLLKSSSYFEVIT